MGPNQVNDNEKTISIFQEWVPGSVTTLLVNFGPFSDGRIADYTKQILQGLVYLHSERVIHRDIKGGNILIDDRGVVKLCDFGASKVRTRRNRCGLSTPQFFVAFPVSVDRTKFTSSNRERKRQTLIYKTNKL